MDLERSRALKIGMHGENDRRLARAQGHGDRYEIHVLEPRWATVVRFRAALDQLPRGFFHRYAMLAANIIRSGQRPLGPPFAIFGRSDDNAVDIEAGFLVKERIDPFDETETKRLEGGPVVALTHTGPYEQIGASYYELLGWMEEDGLGRGGPFMEMYLNGPDTADPRKTSTRIVVPVCSLSQHDRPA